MRPTHAKKSKASARTRTPFLDLLKIDTPAGKRGLSIAERHDLVLMLAQKAEAPAFDTDRLAPPGSYLHSMLRHFDKTDISYAMPLFQLVSIAAAWLAQNGAYLDVQGAGRIRPTLWTIGLAESGSSKTLAFDRVWKIMSSEEGFPPVAKLGTVSTAAQWIIDLEASNGAFWLQDEVGKFIKDMNTSSNLTQLKAWMLDAYSSAEIGNRLKSEQKKLVIKDPHFTFHGMTVLSTWAHDVNATTMMDGWCQRMSYYAAPARTDTNIFDHFIYFEGADVPAREQELRVTWQALCAQPGAAGQYHLHPDALDFLVLWWKALEKAWGDFALPASFLRRIGYSVLRYLVVLQFLLGKSHLPIDIETANIATAFAEYHMESALMLVQSYDQSAASNLQRVAELRKSIKDKGEEPTARNIVRRLSKPARAATGTPMVKMILAVLDNAEKEGTSGFPVETVRKEKSAAILKDWTVWLDRAKRTERRRNERRIRELRRAHALAEQCVLVEDLPANVLEFRSLQGSATDDSPGRSAAS